MRLASTLLLSTLAMACHKEPTATADRATLVLVGGDVITNLPDQPRVSAVAEIGRAHV